MRVGKERADTLARELFCQSLLTCEDNADEHPAAGFGATRYEPRRGGGTVRLHSVLETANELVCVCIEQIRLECLMRSVGSIINTSRLTGNSYCYQI